MTLTEIQTLVNWILTNPVTTEQIEQRLLSRHDHRELTHSTIAQLLTQLKESFTN